MSTTQVFPVTLAQLSNGYFAPDTSGTFHLRIDPFNSNTYTASIGASGNLLFTLTNYVAGCYRVYDNSGSQVTSWGTRWIGADLIAKYALTSDIAALQTVDTTLQSEIDNLESATANLQSEINSTNALSANYYSLSSTNTANSYTPINFHGQVVFNNNVPPPYLFSAPVSGFHIASKGYVDDKTSGTGSLSGYATLTGINTFSGTNYFTSTNINFTNPPTCNAEPTYTNELARKSYVDWKFDNVAPITGAISAYNQAYQVTRLHYNGIAVSNKVYTSITGSVACSLTANSAPSSANQKCIVIENLGNTSLIQDWIHNPGNSRYLFSDWIHVVGSTPNIKINTQPFSASITASITGAIIYENLNFYGIGDDSTTFENIVFKNCTFEARTDGYGSFFYDFTNCNFISGNEFIGNASNFINCSGERIYSEVTPNISGTNKLQYYTPTKIAIGTKTIKDNSSELYIDTSLSISGSLNIYAQTTLTACTTDYVADIYINGNRYLLPLKKNY